MKILTISGSAREGSSNTLLLNQLAEMSDQLTFFNTSLHFQLPLFTAEQESNPSETVLQWKKELADCDGCIICTPEYLHNIPAVLKNAFEWVSASGELAGKKVLTLTLTPKQPRGQRAMQSLLWSLGALEATVLASLEIYLDELEYTENGLLMGENSELLKEALLLFF